MIPFARLRRAALLAFAIGLSLGVAGCGGGSKDTWVLWDDPLDMPAETTTAA